MEKSKILERIMRITCTQEKDIVFCGYYEKSKLIVFTENNHPKLICLIQYDGSYSYLNVKDNSNIVMEDDKLKMGDEIIYLGYRSKEIGHTLTSIAGDEINDKTCWEGVIIDQFSYSHFKFDESIVYEDKNYVAVNFHIYRENYLVIVDKNTKKIIKFQEVKKYFPELIMSTKQPYYFTMEDGKVICYKISGEKVDEISLTCPNEVSPRLIGSDDGFGLRIRLNRKKRIVLYFKIENDKIVFDKKEINIEKDETEYDVYKYLTESDKDLIQYLRDAEGYE